MRGKTRKKKKNKFKFFIFLGILAYIILVIIRILIPSNNNSNIRTIVIDAGHGDHDPGTIAVNGTYEKNLVLDISKKLNKRLKRSGYKTIMIRDEDTYTENIDRARIANEKNADIYISIHGNAMENNPEIKGIQVLYFPGDQNAKCADKIRNEIISYTGAIDKGIIEREDLIVLNKTKMPAFLIEVGFLSNPEEADRLIKESYQDDIVDGIVSGIDNL